jgi:hypothetical protein
MNAQTLVLRPSSDALEAVELPSDVGRGGTHLLALYEALDVQFVDVIRLSDDIDGWVDDEFRVNGAEPNRLATAMFRAFGWHLNHGDDIRGAVLFAGHDGEGGMCSLSARQDAIVRDAFAQALRM